MGCQVLSSSQGQSQGHQAGCTLQIPAFFWTPLEANSVAVFQQPVADDFGGIGFANNFAPVFGVTQKNFPVLLAPLILQHGCLEKLILETCHGTICSSTW